jgi:putative glutamine amidotransferase
VTPLVVVSTGRRGSRGREHVALNVNYVRALTGVGLVPVLVPPFLDVEHTGPVLDAVAGVMLTGGPDVHPRTYGEAPHPRLEETDPDRDTVEIALLRGARERRLPVLAICRGMQLVNAALGGTLLQDLPSERPSSTRHADRRTRHPLRIASGSLLHRTNGELASVNSRHHQAVKDIAPGLRAVAWAEDGVIEALEWAEEADPWMLAVQWHPEDEPDAALFGGFAQAVGTVALTGSAARDPG